MTTIRNTEHYFGACPECGDYDGYVNVGGNHWMVCDQHKTKWCVGWNLFSDWKDETQEVWDRNAERLAGYRKVEPLPQEASPGFTPERIEEQFQDALASRAATVDERMVMVPNDACQELGVTDWHTEMTTDRHPIAQDATMAVLGELRAEVARFAAGRMPSLPGASGSNQEPSMTRRRELYDEVEAGGPEFDVHLPQYLERVLATACQTVADVNNWLAEMHCASEAGKWGPPVTGPIALKTEASVLKDHCERLCALAELLHGYRMRLNPDA